MQLSDFTAAFAQGIVLADARAPTASSSRTGLRYRAGIGPHTESQTIDLVLAEMPRASFAREVLYPNLARSRCDLVVGEHNEWAIEFKLLRLMGDNGKPNDNMLMHLLSPYPAHRSALTDCTKLLASGFEGRKAVVVFGYDYDAWPMALAIEAFDTLATQRANLIAAEVASFDGLIHPVHQRGHVYAWEVIQKGGVSE